MKETDETMEVNGTRHNLSPVEWETIFIFFSNFFFFWEEKCCLPPGHRGLQFTNRRLTQNWNDGKETKQRPVYSAAVKNTDIILTYCCCLQPDIIIYQLRGAYLKLSMSVVWDLKWSIQLE